MISKKIILTGSFGVGKTSLFNQFIYNQFSDKYLTTIGVKVNKKTIMVGDRELSMLVWDIAGEISQEKVPTSYFLGASGVIYVIDLTRPSTFVNMKADIAFLTDILPDGIIKVVANKRDLIPTEHLDSLLASLSIQANIVTSAKTGENVENLFASMGEDLIAVHYAG
jgi:small GTP-binding protein